MLCLTRRHGESIVLETADGPVKLVVQLIAVRGRGGWGKAARLCIDAPESVRIRREELPAADSPEDSA